MNENWYGQGMIIKSTSKANGKGEAKNTAGVNKVAAMIDEEERCIAAGDKAGLLKLADQYARRGAKTTAKRLRVKAAEL